MMVSSAEYTRGHAGWGLARPLRLGLDAAWHPCCARCAEGADGARGRGAAAVRSLGLRSLAGTPARGVKPQRLRSLGADQWGLRAPTPRGLRSAGGMAQGTATRPACLGRHRVVLTGRSGRRLRGAGRVGLLGGQEGRRVVGLLLGPHGVDKADPLVGQGTPWSWGVGPLYTALAAHPSMVDSPQD